MDEQKDRAIALELSTSYNTLRSQLSRLYRKLGVQTRIGVAVAVFETFIKMRQMETNTAEQQDRQSEQDEA